MLLRLQARFWYRSITVLFGAWFALATADLASVHQCPMHDGPLPMAMGPDHDMAQHHGAAPSSDSTPASSHSCTCIGTCCAATVPLPAAEQVVAFLETLHAPVTLASAPVFVVRVSLVDFVLPFSTAPPMSARA